MFELKKQPVMPTAEEALPGREQAMLISNRHYVNGHPLKPPYGEGLSMALFGLGCFWGAERRFWQYPGVYSTAVGYAAGFTPNPHYEEVCSGLTGHNEVVRVVFDEKHCDYAQLVKLFFESHDPTQGMGQGNDRGTQYRSGIYYENDRQRDIAQALKEQYQRKLDEKKLGQITTEILPAGPFYYAEDYHQQYLAKNPNGYCGLGGTGIQFDEETGGRV